MSRRARGQHSAGSKSRVLAGWLLLPNSCAHFKCKIVEPEMVQGSRGGDVPVH